MDTLPVVVGYKRISTFGGFKDSVSRLRKTHVPGDGERLSGINNLTQTRSIDGIATEGSGRLLDTGRGQAG